MSKLSEIWKNRKEILEGVKNTVVKDEFVEQVAEHRMKICKSCEYYDGKCAVGGTAPCCGACGCSLGFKTRAMSTFCGLTKLGKDPKWLPVMTQEQEDKMLAEEMALLQKKQDEE